MLGVGETKLFFIKGDQTLLARNLDFLRLDASLSAGHERRTVLDLDYKWRGINLSQ